MSEAIELQIVREKGGRGIRCVYLGHLRIFGGKPYVSERLPFESITLDGARIKEALELEERMRPTPEHAAPKDADT